MEEKFLRSWADALDACDALGVRTKRTRGNLTLANAKRILSGRRCSDEFSALEKLGRLELSLENLVLKSAFGALFSDQEVNTALSRLLEAGYDFK